MFSLTSLLVISTGFCFGLLTGLYVYPLMNGEKESIGELMDMIMETVMETEVKKEEEKKPTMLDKAIQTELDKEVDVKDYYFVNQ